MFHDKKKSNAVVVGAVGSMGVIILAPNRRKKFYDSTIEVPKRRRLECNLHYEGPLTPAHLLKKEVNLNLFIQSNVMFV